MIAGCSAPEWHARAVPAGTTLVVDGIERGTEPIDEPIPYYGTVDLAAVPPPRPAAEPGAPPLPLSTGRVRFEIDEPAPPWLFPFDFFAELAQLPFGEPVEATVVVEAPPRPDVSRPGEVPDDLAAFAARARAEQAAR